jgi:hypothetical protein
MREGISRHSQGTVDGLADGFASKIVGFHWIHLRLEKASFWRLETWRLCVVNLLKLKLDLDLDLDLEWKERR